MFNSLSLNYQRATTRLKQLPVMNFEDFVLVWMEVDSKDVDDLMGSNQSFHGNSMGLNVLKAMGYRTNHSIAMFFGEMMEYRIARWCPDSVPPVFIGHLGSVINEDRSSFPTTPPFFQLNRICSVHCVHCFCFFAWAFGSSLANGSATVTDARDYLQSGSAMLALNAPDSNPLLWYHTTLGDPKSKEPNSNP